MDIELAGKVAAGLEHQQVLMKCINLVLALFKDTGVDVNMLVPFLVYDAKAEQLEDIIAYLENTDHDQDSKRLNVAADVVAVHDIAMGDEFKTMRCSGWRNRVKENVK